MRDGQLKIVRWGNVRQQSERLPRTGWTYLADCQQCEWVGAEEVVIPATCRMENGFWTSARQGIRGLLVPDEKGISITYMLVGHASQYNHVGMCP
jgi:hypothetical protein